MKLTSFLKSNLFSIFFSKKVFLCLVFLCFVGSVFGAEYVWTGGGDGSTWTNVANWGGSGYPGASDNATFSSGAEVTITSDITVYQIYLNAGSKVTCDSNVTISLNSIITQGEFLNKGTLQKRENGSFIIKVEAGGKLINENKIICTDIEGLGNSNITNNGTIEASGAATFQSGANFTNADTSKLYIVGAMTNVGTFSNSGGTVTVKGTTTNTGTITNTGDFTSEGPMTNVGTFSNSGGTVTVKGRTTNTGTITNTGDFTSEDVITNTGKVTISGGTIAGNINNSGSLEKTGGTITGDITNTGGGTYEDVPIVVYSTIDRSDTVLDWNATSSWENGVDISGNTAVKITLNADVKSTTDLTFNNSGSEQIDLYLNGHTLDLSECRFILGNGIGNVNIYGPGNVKVKTFDPYDNGSDSNSPHILNLWKKTEFYIFESLYSSGSTVKITDKTGDCKFYLTASGENVNYGASGIDYDGIEPEPYGEPKIYRVIDNGGNPFETGREIQLNTSRVSTQTYSPIQFQYSVNILGGSWTLKVGDEERELSSIDSSDSSPLPFIELGANETSKNFILKCSTNIGDGIGIVITIRTPDGTMDLAKIRWIKGEVQWTGAKDTDFSNPENWSQNETPLTDISALKNNIVVIPSGRTNYPVLERENSVKEIRIQDNASLKIEEGGLLLTEKLIISETGKVDGKNGAIKLCKVTTDSNQVEEVKLENSGWFEVGKLSFEPSSKGIIFGTENQAKTKISELVCENQGGKTLEIKNTISVETLNLSGASLDNLLSVKNSSEATGTVYLSNNSTGKYLKLATDSLVTVKTSKISISKSDTSAISDETDFSEKGWVKAENKDFATIPSTGKLEWNNPESWTDITGDGVGDIPDLSGEIEVNITLNADLNIDNALFYKKNNAKINLTTNGKSLYYAGRKAYVSHSNGSGDPLEWSNTENWLGGAVPDISGSTPVSIILNGDFEAESLIFNEEAKSEIHIYVNGNTLKLNGTTWFGNHIKTLILGQEIVTKRVPSNLHFYGDGEIYISVLEFAKKTGEDNKNQVKLYDGIEIYITDHISPLDTHAEITRDSEESKFYLNASGTNVIWELDAVQINWVNFEPIPHGPQTFYKITDEGGTPTSENRKTITFTREGDSNSVENTIKYKVQIIENDSTNEETWKLGYGDEYEVLSPSDGYDYSVKFVAGENSFQKILKASGKVDSGDGIIITFRTPDDKMDMCEIRYVQGELLWTGAASTDSTNILNPANWSYYKDTLTEETLTKEELTKLLTEEEAVIGSGATNYPKITSSVNVKQLTVKNGANITVTESGVLTVSDSLIFEGNSKIDARAGKVVFGTGKEENPSFEATYPEFSTFGTLEVAPNATFVTETDLYITKSLLNNGIFQAGKVYLEPSEDKDYLEPSEEGYLEPSEDTVTITGHEEDSAASAQKTKIGELFWENQSNKTLVINNVISVDTIKLSGNANINERKLTVKYDNENYSAGIIYLSKKATAQFLFLSDENLVTIKNARISVVESDLSNVNNPTGSESVFYTRGWRVLGAIPTEYTWEGTSSSDWFEKENWKEKHVPTSKEGAEVTIPSGCSNYPVLTKNVNLTEPGYELDSIFIESGASITLENFSLSVTTITNMGEIGSETSVTINSSNVILAGTINAESNISISGNLYIIGESSISFGENFFVGTQSEPKDVYISAMNAGSPVDVEIASKDTQNQEFQIYGNFALFNGDVSLRTELVVGKDMILLNGKTFGENSIYKDSMTGFDLYKYHLDNRPVSCNLEAFPTDIPNNENISISHEEYKSTFMVENGKTILVGNNFYNNGVDLGTNTTGSWFLKIPANDLATSSFAECYNATITNCTVVSANTSPGEAWLSTENCNYGTGNTNTNVAFSKAVLSSTEVSTISDNIIRVSFVDGNSSEEPKPSIRIENSCNEISAWAATDNFRFNISSELPEGVAFSGIFANPECTESTNGKGDLSTFYLKYDIPTDGSTDYRWNTDATGSDSGAEESTDYSRKHKNVVPNLLFKRAIEASYVGLRDEHKNRLVSVGTNTAGAEPLFEATKDEAPPVLVAVTLGQEQHETEATAQHHYDSHNFIEWQFSEAVEITYNGTSTGTEILSDAENIQSTENFGKIINKESGFSVAGFGSFETGKVSLGSKTGSGEVNAFYRKFALEAGEEAISQKNRIRLSIAGYVDEGNPVTVNGVDYNNWLGFIDSKNTSIPFGTFTMEDSAFLSIKDKSENKNVFVAAKNQPITVNNVLSSMAEETKGKTLYGTWDIDPPVVANYMKESFNKVYAQEILPVGDLTSDSAKSLEIHFLDNSAYNTLEGKNNLQWRTKIGWKENNVQITQTIPLDTKGGSRMSSAENQTLGGLRISSIVDSIKAFSYKNIDLDTIKSFDNTKYSQELVYENFFGSFPEMVLDIPYLKLYFSEKDTENMQNHNFQLIYQQRDSYGNLQGFVTDLAGNLLYDFVASSPDKSPPKISLSIGGVNKDSLYILFSKSIDWKDENDAPDEGKLRRIVKSLGIFESSSGTEKNTGLIDFSRGSRATVITETGKNTGIEISLTRAVSYEELKNLYIGVNSFDSEGFPDADGDTSLGDPISGLPGNYSMLYDLFENPISKDLKHCFSDFAVNALEVLYAYDGRTPENAVLGQGVYGGNQWTITDFSGNSSNSSKIISKRDISIAAKITNFSENANSQDKFSMIADISPNQNATGSDFELLTGINPRLWFLDSISHYSTQINSSNYVETDNLYSKNGKIETEISGNKNQNFTYVIPNAQENPEALEWKAGSQIQFLFKILNADGNPVMVDVNHDGKIQEDVDHPLYAVRLNDETDLTSIDLWSLNIVELLRQKGNVTILNNVINPLNQEETVVEVSTEESGNLRVEILTLDGNVIKVLQRGRIEKGLHYFKWDGKNLAGNPVARGMYFIRVVGPGIDETRKVMIVWEN